MSVKGIIFDLDGTLVHTIEDIGDAANAMLKLHDLPQHTLTDYLKWIGNGASKFIENALPEEIAVSQLGPYVTEFMEIYSRNLSSKSRLYEGIPELLDELESLGVRISILSNKPQHLTRKVAHYYLSAWEINPIFGQREHVPRKPDPAAAFEIASLLQIPEKQMLFIGDSMGDLITAEAAGMIPLGVTWGYGRLDQVPQNGTKYITHPQEVLSHLS